MATYKDYLLQALDEMRDRVMHDRPLSPTLVLKFVSWAHHWNLGRRRSP